MDELTRLSERLVVMSEHGASLLTSVHGVDPRKIDLIPHGIPDVPRRQVEAKTSSASRASR